MEKTFLLSHGELKIPCKLSTPDYGEIRRVVLSVHGFGGSTNDTIQTNIAEEMTMFSSASLRKPTFTLSFPASSLQPEFVDSLSPDAERSGKNNPGRGGVWKDGRQSVKCGRWNPRQKLKRL